MEVVGPLVEVKITQELVNKYLYCSICRDEIAWTSHTTMVLYDSTSDSILHKRCRKDAIMRAIISYNYTDEQVATKFSLNVWSARRLVADSHRFARLTRSI